MLGPTWSKLRAYNTYNTSNRSNSIMSQRAREAKQVIERISHQITCKLLEPIQFDSICIPIFISIWISICVTVVLFAHEYLPEVEWIDCVAEFIGWIEIKVHIWISFGFSFKRDTCVNCPWSTTLIWYMSEHLELVRSFMLDHNERTSREWCMICIWHINSYWLTLTLHSSIS